MYQYKIRTESQSEKVVIEFPEIQEPDTFSTDLMNAIVLLQPQMLLQETLNLKSGTYFYFKTALGKFELRILANKKGQIFSENEQLLLMIESRLQLSPIFEKIELSFEDYL